jgi:hypothetical protein
MSERICEAVLVVPSGAACFDVGVGMFSAEGTAEGGYSRIVENGTGFDISVTC